MKKKPEAIVLYSSTDHEADLYYVTKMHVGDPFLYVEVKGRKKIVMSDLEIGRARDEADVQEVVSLSALNARIKKGGIEVPGPGDHAYELLRAAGVRRVVVPATFPVAVADRLRARGIRVRVKPAPFFERRVVKTPAEVRAIEECQRVNEYALERALEILRRSRIVGRRLQYRGEVLTAEFLRRVIQSAHMERDCTGKHTIVASGDQGCDPHNRGSGPILANTSIILDIFPRSNVTSYYSDMTRTVCRGKPSRDLEKLYGTVLEGQQLGCRMIRAGVKGSDVHGAILEMFRTRGYETEERNGKMVGFFHGTGHGIGLDVHEPPRVSWSPERLPEGTVVTCEPGLYYPGIGAVRIEDMLLVGRTRSRNLMKASYEFVI